MKLSRVESLLLVAMVVIGAFLVIKYLATRAARDAIATSSPQTLQSTQQPTKQPDRLMVSPAKRAGCSGDQENYLVLKRPQIVGLHTGEAFIVLSKDDQATVCTKLGTTVHLVSRAKAGEEPFFYRGHAIVYEVQASGDVRLKVEQVQLGRSLKMLPLCLDDCDGIVSAVPSSTPDSPTYLIEDLRASQNSGLRWKLGADAEWSELPDAEVETWLTTMAYKFARASVVVATVVPFRSQIGVRRLMRKIKGAGAKKTYWLYHGTASLRGRPPEPPPVPGARAVRAVEVEKLLKSKAVFVYAKGPQPELRPVFFEKSLVVSAKLDDDQPNAGLTPTFLRAWSDPLNFDLKALPADKNAEYVVYGLGREEWRSWHLVRLLKSLGYQNVLWFQGGIREYEDAIRFDVVQRLYGGGVDGSDDR